MNLHLHLHLHVRVWFFFFFFWWEMDSWGAERGGAGEGINVINIKIDARLVFVL